MRIISSLVFMYVGIMNEVSRIKPKKSLSLNIQEISHLELTKLLIFIFIFPVHSSCFADPGCSFYRRVGFI